MKRSTLILAVMALILFQEASFAVGALYARRPNTTDNMFPLWIKSYDASVSITDQMAVTHITQVFKNETTMILEGICIFPLPPNAVVTEMALWENGVRMVGKVMETERAQQIYQSFVNQKIDPALMQYIGKNVYKLSIFPINAVGQNDSERKVEITYAELLPYDAGTISYQYLMKTINLSPKPVQRASLAITLKTQNTITSMSCSTHGATDGLVMKKTSATAYSITYGQENAQSEKDLTLLYRLENAGFALTNMTYTPGEASGLAFDKAGDDPYYLTWVTPPDSITKIEVISKNIAFVADVSSSMAGARIAQLRSALATMVGKLNAFDRFNIIPFSTGAMPYKTDLIPATKQNVAAAQDFVAQLGESGMTNMEDALKLALKSTWVDTSVNVIVFLTDGKPTWPINTSGDKIIEAVKTNNVKSIQIFTFGIGSDVENGFLKLLARNNGAFSTLIQANDSISLAMSAFMDKISYPLIKNLSVDFGTLNRYDIFPRITPNIYSGTQLVQLGRYRNKGTFDVTCTGTVGSKPITFGKALAFPATTTSPSVPRLWASAKIDYLLDEISIYGESKELVDAVVALSIKYNILTPYTSSIAIPTTGVREDKRLPTVKALQLNNYPNPFAASTVIRYALPRRVQPAMLTLKIFDARGKIVRTLVNELTMGGNFEVKWDALDQGGRRVAAGFYLAVVEVGELRQMIRMRLVN
jgi:Ca-activated chloride channel family protein